METDTTFGFDSARHIATEAIDRLHSTAQSHHRVMIVEVMGRNAGWLALESGIAGGGDIILLPELAYDIEEIIRVVRQRSRFGKRFSIVVVAEGAKPMGGKQVVKKMVADSPEKVRLGGIGHQIANEIEKHTEIECRVAIIGHLQRGGTPTPQDRILATQFAVKAMKLVATEKFNEMVAIQGNEITSVPIAKVMGKQKLVPRDSDLIEAGISVGTSFGVKLD
jgi:6-phosphofructokinase 1